LKKRFATEEKKTQIKERKEKLKGIDYGRF